MIIPPDAATPGYVNKIVRFGKSPHEWAMPGPAEGLPDHCYLEEFVPGYRYWDIDPAHRDIATPDNWVGYQQRAFSIFWSMNMALTIGGVGLDVGSGGDAISPGCIGIDLYSQATGHPMYKTCSDPHLICDGQELGMLFPNRFTLVLANHAFEHFSRPLDALIGFWRVLRVFGVCAMIMPDANFVKPMDSTHERDWTPETFADFIKECPVPWHVMYFDTLKNNFSFDIVLKKLPPTEIVNGEEVPMQPSLAKLWKR